jgi:hypothetical protein
VEFAPPRQFARPAATTFGRSFRPWRFWSAIKMSMPIRRGRLAAYATLVLLGSLCFGYFVVQGVTAARVRYLMQINQSQFVVITFPGSQSVMKFPKGQGPRGLPGTAVTIEHSYVAAVVEAILFPGSNSSLGTFGPASLPQQARSYPAPRQLHVTLMSMGGPVGISGSAVHATATALGVATWVWLLQPASFLLLPVSRRRARVRWEHLIRVAAYGVFVPATVIVAATALIGLGLVQGADLPLGLAHYLLRYGIVLLLAAWWAAAIARYLRMPHSLGVAVLLTVLAGLLFLAVLWLAAPDFLVSVIEHFP